MKCINCGGEISEGSAYCSKCGTQVNQNLTQNSDIKPNLDNQNTNMVNNTMVNMNSNNNQTTPLRESTTENNFNQNFMSPNNNYNQNSNQNNSNVNQTPSSNNRSKKPIIIVAVVVAVLVLGFGGYYIYLQYMLNLADKELQNQVENLWGTNEDNNQTNETTKYEVGTAVTLVDGSSWYVVSQEDSTVTLFSSETYGEKTRFSNSVNDYEKSIVKEKLENEFLPNLKSSIAANGGDVTNLSVRIISVEEIREILNIPSSVANEDIEISGSYKWLFDPGSYWTSTQGKTNESDSYVYVHFVTSWVSFGTVDDDNAGYGFNNGNEFYIRPVIETSIDNIAQ